MRIPGDISKIAGVYGQQKNVNQVGKTGPVARKKDIVSISGQAKDYQTVIRALKEVPDVRPERVNKLSAQYDAGKYSIDGKEIVANVAKKPFDIKA